MFKLNGTKVEMIRFPAGEVSPKLNAEQIKELENLSVTIEWKFEDTSEIFELVQLVDAIRGVYFNCSIDLVIPYLPFSRQDRYVNVGESNSVKTLAILLGELGLQNITSYDCHSPVFQNTLRHTNFLEVDQTYCFFKTHMPIIKSGDAVIISPDQGASKKSLSVASRLNAPIIQCLKSRDLQNGNLNKLEIFTSLTTYELSNKDFWVVDDICDGGATFITLAIKFKEFAKQKNFKINSLNLYTTHGIYSKGIEALEEHYDQVVCYNDMQNNSN